MVIEVPDDLATYVINEVAEGRFPSESEVVCAAIRLLQLQQLRNEIQAGLANLEDDLELADEAELEAYLIRTLCA